jgi:hypothetical protein
MSVAVAFRIKASLAVNGYSLSKSDNAEAVRLCGVRRVGLS